MIDRIHVMAGVLHDAAAGLVLVARRPSGGDAGGLWEFPGGKREAGEAPFDALARELDEELGVRVMAARPLIAVPFDYPGKCILLDAWTVDAWEGEPFPHEHQALRWATLPELDALSMPLADRPVVAALRLPHRYLMTPDWPLSRAADLRDGLLRSVAEGIRLIRLRLPQWPVEALQRFVSDLLPDLREEGTQLLASDVHTALHGGFHGVHLSATTTLRLSKRPLPTTQWFAVSCHDAAEVGHAVRIGADFITLSPVNATASHPLAKPMGWSVFQSLASQCPLPVYALGGLGAADLAAAHENGAQGIAGIGRLWSG